MPKYTADKKPTVEGFSWLLLVLSVVALAIFLLLKMLYDDSTNSIGMPPESAGIVISAFVPVVVVTVTGLRNRLASGVRFGNESLKRTPISAGYGFLLTLGTLGPISGILVMFFLSTGLIKVDAASWWVGGAASVWGFSTAYVISIIDKKFPLA